MGSQRLRYIEIGSHSWKTNVFVEISSNGQNGPGVNLIK